MERALKLSDVLRVARPDPLKGEDFEKFFVETDEARGEEVALHLSGYFKVNRDVVDFLREKGEIDGRRTDQDAE